MSEETSDFVEREARIQVRVKKLAELHQDEEARRCLHPVELAIVEDILLEPRHLRCAGCLRLLDVLIDLMTSGKR